MAKPAPEKKIKKLTPAPKQTDLVGKLMLQLDRVHKRG